MGAIAMPVNPPLKLVAIDPGLAHVGLAVVSVVGLSQLVIEHTRTLHTPPGQPWLERITMITDWLEPFLDEVDGSGYVVIEDPTQMILSDRQGQRRDPRTLYELCAAYGVIVAQALDVVGGPQLELVPVNRWYPRADRGHLKQADVLAHIRARYPQLVGKSEHVAMAIGLGSWWSQSVAPRIWFELQRVVPA